MYCFMHSSGAKVQKCEHMANNLSNMFMNTFVIQYSFSSQVRRGVVCMLWQKGRSIIRRGDTLGI